jgi:dolichyl-phosphate-mannose-protein mannosyltransferase
VPKSFALASRRTAVFVLLVSVFGFFSYVFNYAYPPYFFWDENYFLASAQKYLNGIYFMEPHPPLAKLFIALGEYLLNANVVDTSFIGTDYGRDLPSGFSFTGYRLFPVLFAWAGSPIFFLIILLITRNHLSSLFLSFLYIFDNAMIVHFRGAMLDSTMIFFVLLTILAFLLLLEKKDGVMSSHLSKDMTPSFSVLFGISLAGVATTKVLGLIVLLLIPALLFRWKKEKISWKPFLMFGGLSFFIVYFAVWQTHFTLGKTVNPDLPDQGYYQASDSYKQILTQEKTGNPLYFPTMLRDSWRFLFHYERGVPRLDLCKTDENGSPWFMWPFGARTINYRWETPDGEHYQYLYLQSNPAAWGLGLFGIVMASAMLLSRIFFPSRQKLKHSYLITVFVCMYASYMFVMATVSRVMYLYHYFIPLIFSFILFALVFDELKAISTWKLPAPKKLGLISLIGAVIFLSYQAYRPFTYYEPISDAQLKVRSLSDFWDLKCVNCQKNNPIARPK